MGDQLSLIEQLERLVTQYQEPARARRTDPDTSHEAAAQMTEERLSRLQIIVLRALVAIGGQGRTELVVDATGGDWPDITPRFRPLVRKGMVVELGKEKGGKGRNQTVWAITKRGRAWLEKHPPPKGNG